MNSPKYLYHYTSIDILEKIISTRKLKFNRLDKVDDLNEGKTQDLGNLGMYIFASCWTEETNENIPLWNMYTDGMRGVRIKMSTDLIEPHIPSDKEIEKWAKIKFIIEKGTGFLTPIEEMHGPDFIFGVWPKNFLFKVEYTNDSNTLFPETYRNENMYHVIKFGIIGRAKRLEWKFQSEWRYSFIVMPAPPPPITSYDNYENDYGESYEALTQKVFAKRHISVNEICLSVKSKALETMEVMLGPKSTVDDHDRIYKIVKNINSSIPITVSSLSGQIR